MNDKVNHPSHYTQRGIECIDAIECITLDLNGFEGYCIGNILKYIWRWKDKNGLEDLKKAQWYINKLIETVETDELGKQILSLADLLNKEKLMVKNK